MGTFFNIENMSPFYSIFKRSVFLFLFFLFFDLFPSLSAQAPAVSGDFPGRNIPSAELESREEKPVHPRVRLAGIKWGTAIQLALPLAATVNNAVALIPGGLVGLNLSSLRNKWLGSLDADFSVGAILNYGPPNIYAESRFTLQNLFQLGKTDRRFRVYAGFDLLLQSYTGYTGTSVSTPAANPLAFLDWRAVYNLAFLIDVERRWGAPLSLNNPVGLPNKMLGIVLNFPSVGIGDHSAQTIIQNPSFLALDYWGVELFYTRLNPSGMWMYRGSLTAKVIPLQGLPFTFSDLYWRLEFSVGYSWRWE